MDDKINNIVNPFNITKAVDLSDEEIDKLWVDISDKRGFGSIIKPTSPMSMFILGGKGGGKTHVMRYYSFSLQKIRNQGKLINGIVNEGYIGIYFRCSGLNASRFLGKNQSAQRWQSIFAYSLELWLSQLLLQILADIQKNDSSCVLNENNLINSIVEIFDKYPEENIPKSLTALIKSFENLRKEIDYIVNNSAWTGDVGDLKIAASHGKLVFEIPRVIIQNIKRFKDLKFVYLIDEFENLDIIHQEYINTLIRERSAPSSIKVGAKLYGVRTNKTLSAGEENKEGSEYEKVVIDEYFRTVNKKYINFAEKLCNKRLLESGYFSDKSLDSSFESFSFPKFAKEYNEKYKGKQRPHLERLKANLKQYGCHDNNDIIDTLAFSADPLIERTNIFLLYRSWSKNQNVQHLKKAADNIAQEAAKFCKDTKFAGEHNKILNKYKADILAQLLLENSERTPYCGIKSFIEMSEGIPRNLLMILKNIFRWSTFNGEEPFQKGKISLESQYKGVQDASAWFFDDARLSSFEGKRVKDSIYRLCHFLREIRFSNLPPECSISAFRINPSHISQEALEIIQLSTQCSYLIKTGERKDKNSRRIDNIYKVNGTLAPKWDLPIFKRGEIHLSKEESEAIFNATNDDGFNNILRKRLSKYNAPFGAASSAFGQYLFEDSDE